MRSRTELVTTTFDLDSDEEDYSPDDDDSEEDWRPNKKRQQKQPRATNSGNSNQEAAGGRKRKTSATTAAAALKAKRRAVAVKVSDDDLESVDDDGDGDNDDELDTEQSEDELEFPTASTSAKRLQPFMPPKKQLVQPIQQDLLINKRELCAKDWQQNSRLCLWRKDEKTNLLQKYLRVKMSQEEQQQLLFTSSSVYSSWDEQHISDFVSVKVNCLDPNNRRIQLADIEAVKKLSIDLQTEQDSKEPAHSAQDDEENVDDEQTAV